MEFVTPLQSSGYNDHPTPQQFLVTVNCMSFYNLAKSISQGNSESNMISALLDVESLDTAEVHQAANELISNNELNGAESALGKGQSKDHDAYVSANGQCQVDLPHFRLCCKEMCTSYQVQCML